MFGMCYNSEEFLNLEKELSDISKKQIALENLMEGLETITEEMVEEYKSYRNNYIETGNKLAKLGFEIGEKRFKEYETKSMNNFIERNKDKIQK